MKKSISNKMKKAAIGVVVVGGITAAATYQRNSFDSGRLNQDLYDFLENEAAASKQGKSIAEDEPDSADNQLHEAKKEQDSSKKLPDSNVVRVDEEVLRQMKDTSKKLPEQTSGGKSLNVLPKDRNLSGADGTEGGKTTGAVAASKKNTSTEQGKIPGSSAGTGDKKDGQMAADSGKPSSGQTDPSPGGNPQGSESGRTPADDKQPVDVKVPVYTRHPVLDQTGSDSNNIFPKAGVDTSKSGKKIKIDTMVVNELDPKSYVHPPKLLKGEELTERSVLYSLEVKVYLSNGDMYRITDEQNENVKIAFTRASDDSNVAVQISVRLNPDSEWVTSEETKLVLYDERTIVVDSKGNMLFDEYHQLGDVFHIWAADHLQEKYATVSYLKGAEDEGRLSGVFTGYSYTVNGEPIRESYEIKESGEHMLFMRDPVKLSKDSSYQVRLSSHRDEKGTLIYDQILEHYRNPEEELDVPFGVTKVQNVQAELIRIPSSVSEVDMKNGSSWKGYVLSEDNRYLKVTDEGFLMNQKETELYGIPAERTTVDLPDGVEKISCGFESDQVVFLSGKNIPAFDFQNYVKYRAEEDRAIFVIPEAQYRNLIATWQVAEKDTGCIMTKEDYEKGIFYNEEGALVQRIANREDLKLHRIPEETSEYYIIGDDIREIGADVYEKNSSVVSIIIPEGVQVIDASVFDGAKIQEVYLLSDTLPEIRNASAFQGQLANIHVKSELRDSLITYMEDCLNTEVRDKVDAAADNILRGKDGSIYMIYDGFGFLLQASKTAETFTPEDIPEEVILDSVTEGAFFNHKKIKYVELPETVMYIGKSAFANCDKLEGVFLHCEERLEIAEKAFDQCESLRFIATNASEIVCKDLDQYSASRHMFYGEDGMYIIGSIFTVHGASGTQGCAHAASVADRMEAERFGDGYILYGNYTDKETGATRKIVLSAVSGISGDIRFPEGTDSIYKEAFADIASKYSIASDSWEEITSIGNNAFLSSTGFRGDAAGNLVLHKKIKEIGTEAFFGCKSIETLQVDTGLEQTYYLFANSTRLKKVTFTENAKVQELGEGAFVNTAVEELHLPKGVEAIGSGAFPVSLKTLCLEGDQPIRLLPQADGFYLKRDEDYTVNNENVRILLHDRPAMEDRKLAEQCIAEWRYLWKDWSDLEGIIQYTRWEFSETYAGEMKQKKIREFVIDELFEAENEIRQIMELPSITMEEYEVKYREELEHLDELLEHLDDESDDWGDDPWGGDWSADWDSDWESNWETHSRENDSKEPDLEETDAESAINEKN